MTLSLKDLQRVLRPLSKLGKGEDFVEINGYKIVVRTLENEEEIQIQRYARAVVPEEGLADQATVVEFLDRIRNASLGYAIVQIDALDLRATPYIETGEKLDNGTPVKRHKHEVLRDEVATWSRDLAKVVFRKYNELSETKEREIEANVRFNEIDYEAEIARLEEKIASLREKKERARGMEDDVRTTLRRKVAGGDESRPASPSTHEPPRTDPSTESLEVGPTSPLADRRIENEEWESPRPTPPPPEPKSVRRPLFAPSASNPPFEGTEPLEELSSDESAFFSTPEGDSFLGEIRSSFEDPNDPRVVEEENRRLAALKNERNVPSTHPGISPRVPSEETSRPRAAGYREGVPVFQMPVQEMGPSAPPSKPLDLTPPSVLNPNFRPRRG